MANQKIKLKRQNQTGAAAVGKVPTPAMLEDGELALNTVDGKLFLKQTPVSGVPVVVEVGANPFPTMVANKFLTTDGTNVSWGLPSVVEAARRDIAYTLAPASVMVGMVVYHNGVKFEAAMANDVATSDVIGIVTAITPGVNVTITTSGFIDLQGVLPDGTWVPGSTYFLSATNAGALTNVEPTGTGTISKPLMIAETSTTGFFYNWRGISNDIPVTNINTLLPSQDSLTTGKVLTSGADGSAYWGAGGAGSGAASSIAVTQSLHGFSVGALVRYDGSAGVQKYVLAMADNAANADVVGIVSAVADANNFTIITGGVVSTLSGLTAGTSYFLSSTIAGAYTPTEPTAASAISKPVLMALSSTSAIFYNWRGIGMSVLSVSKEVAAQTGNAGRYLTTNGSATMWGTPVISFNNRNGAVTLTSSDITSALNFTPYDATVNAAGYLTAATGVGSFNGRTGAVTLNLTDMVNAGGAPISSPVFTGNPTAPTPAAGDNDTSIATTAFVRSTINQYGVASFNSRTGAVSLQASDITGAGGALLSSPALSGTPTAPTQAPSDNSTAVATTAYVQTALTTAGSGLGYGQTWQNVIGSRAAGTTYTNTTGKPIMVSVNCKNDFVFFINAIQVGRFNIGQPLSDVTGTFIIPAGSTYQLTTVYGLAGWTELR